MPRQRTKKPDADHTTDQAAEAHYDALAEQHADPATDFRPAEFDPAIQAQEVVHGVAEATRIDPEPARHAHIANPSSTRRESHAAQVGRRHPDKLTVPAGDMRVHLVDKGDNHAGIGIRVSFPEGSKDRPTAEEKEIIRRHVKGEDGQPSGFNWNSQAGMWIKPIIRPGERSDEIPMSRPIAIRLDAETRIKKLAEDLRDHQADPVGFAEAVRQRREHAAQAERVPD